MVRNGAPPRTAPRKTNAGNSCRLQEAIASLAKVGHFYLLLGTGGQVSVMPKFTAFPPKIPVFIGSWNKSTNREISLVWNGTTIALVSVQLIRYTQHRTVL